MFPSHVLALLLVRDANNALTFQKGPGLRQKKNLATFHAARVPFEDHARMLCRARFQENFSCIFCNEMRFGGECFSTLELRWRSQFRSARRREIGHKAGPWRYELAPAVSRLTFAENSNT